MKNLGDTQHDPKDERVANSLSQLGDETTHASEFVEVDVTRLPPVRDRVRVSEAARLLGVTAQAIYFAIRSGSCMVIRTLFG